jgi:hypothetical protein
MYYYVRVREKTALESGRWYWREMVRIWNRNTNRKFHTSHCKTNTQLWIQNNNMESMGVVWKKNTTQTDIEVRVKHKNGKKE